MQERKEKDNPRFRHRSLTMSRSLTQTSEKRIIAVVGEQASGKTCLTKHLVKEDVTRSLEEHKSTIDESHYTMQRMSDGAHEQIQFIDTAPWQEFPVMHRLYIKCCHLAIVTYNVASKTWRNSLLNIIRQIREIRDNVDIIVVGTHSDEMNMFMNITPAHVQEVIGNIPHVYISSVTGFGINHLWHTILTTKSALTAGHLAVQKAKSSPKLNKKQITPTMRKFVKKTSSLFCTSKYQTL